MTGWNVIFNSNIFSLFVIHLKLVLHCAGLQGSVMVWSFSSVCLHIVLLLLFTESFAFFLPVVFLSFPPQSFCMVNRSHVRSCYIWLLFCFLVYLPYFLFSLLLESTIFFVPYLAASTSSVHLLMYIYSGLMNRICVSVPGLCFWFCNHVLNIISSYWMKTSWIMVFCIWSWNIEILTREWWKSAEWDYMRCEDIKKVELSTLTHSINLNI